MKLSMTIDDALASKHCMDKAVNEFKRQIILNAMTKNWLTKENAFVENFNLISRCLEEGIIDDDTEFIKMNENLGLEAENVK